MTEVSDFERAVELAKVNLAANRKYHRNSSKLAWLDATRRQADVVIAKSADLDRYKDEALEAANVFCEFIVNNNLTDRVVEIMLKANEQ